MLILKYNIHYNKTKSLAQLAGVFLLLSSAFSSNRILKSCYKRSPTGSNTYLTVSKSELYNIIDCSFSLCILALAILFLLGVKVFVPMTGDVHDADLTQWLSNFCLQRTGQGRPAIRSAQNSLYVIWNIVNYYFDFTVRWRQFLCMTLFFAFQ